MSNDYLKFVRRLKLWVVLLAILNVTILSTIAVNIYISKKKENVTELKQKGVNHFFTFYLGLSPHQVEQFDSISAQYSSKLEGVRVLMRSVKQRIDMPNVEQDTVALNAIYEDFIAAQSLNRDLVIEFYDNIKSICTPKQASKLNEIILKTTISTESQMSKENLLTTSKTDLLTTKSLDSSGKPKQTQNEPEL